MSRLEFWFEFGSTYSYPAAMRIESLATSRGVSVTWRPFLLGPITWPTLRRTGTFLILTCWNPSSRH